MTAQDPELSAALGWPGGISDPVLDRTLLLQMVAALRLASKQALEALTNCSSEYGHRCNRCDSEVDEGGKVASALRAAPAQQAEPVKQVKTCAWRANLDAIYETECGNLHIVNDGTLEENGMKYCCYCGKEIEDESPT